MNKKSVTKMRLVSKQGSGSSGLVVSNTVKGFKFKFHVNMSFAYKPHAYICIKNK